MERGERGRRAGVRRAGTLVVLLLSLGACADGDVVASSSASASPSKAPAPSTNPASPAPAASPSASGGEDRETLMRLIREDDRILGINAVAGDKFDPDYETSCTETSASVFREAPAVLYLRCPKDEEMFVAAPARALSGSPTVREVVETVLEGPSEQEKRTGFEATATGDSKGFQAAIFDGTAVVNFEPPAPIGTNFPAEVSPLVSSLNSLQEVTRVSLLVDGTPICEPEGCGPKS